MTRLVMYPNGKITFPEPYSGDFKPFYMHFATHHELIGELEPFSIRSESKFDRVKKTQTIQTTYEGARAQGIALAQFLENVKLEYVAMNELETQMEVVRRQMTTLSDTVYINGLAHSLNKTPNYDKHTLCAIGACVVALMTLKDMIDASATVADCVQLENDRLKAISDANRYKQSDDKALSILNRKGYSDKALKELQCEK